MYSVSRDFVRNCQTPMLILPDDTPAHAYQTSVDVASLAPRAEVTVYPWKEPAELKARTINRVRAFLKAHVLRPRPDSLARVPFNRDHSKCVHRRVGKAALSGRVPTSSGSAG